MGKYRRRSCIVARNERSRSNENRLPCEQQRTTHGISCRYVFIDAAFFEGDADLTGRREESGNGGASAAYRRDGIGSNGSLFLGIS